MELNETLRVAAGVASVYFLAVTVINIIYFRFTRRTKPADDGPLVSVILPARNEEHTIRSCLDGLVNQNYKNLEIVVVDDNSSDRTGAIIKKYAHRYPQLTAINGKHLPAGWNGKQFACSQAVDAANGTLLFMTDADVSHGPDSVGYAVASLHRSKASFVSGYIRQHIGSLGEALIVPMTYIMSSLLLPIPVLTSRFFTSWGFGIGQYMIVRSDDFAAAGGYKGIRDSLVEDMAMARAMKQVGRTAFVDAKHTTSCRMYDGYRSAYRGFAKSLFGAVGGRTWVVCMLAAVVGLLVVLPSYRLFCAALRGGAYTSGIALPPLLFTITWTFTVVSRGLHPVHALLYPLSFANLLAIAATSTIKTGFGSGIEWKGRLVRCGQPDLPDPEILNVVGLFRLISFIVYSLVLAVVMVYNKIAFGLKVKGRRHLRGIDGGYFLISNHSLYLDPAVVAHAVFPHKTYFSAMEETFHRPVIGGFIRLLGAFPLPEQSCIRRILPAVEWALQRGRCVHFFPEGELYHYNTDPVEFDEGVFYLARRFQVPVVPVTLVIHSRKIFGKELPHPFIRVTVDIGLPLHWHQTESAASKRQEIRTMAGRARAQMKRSISSNR